MLEAVLVVPGAPKLVPGQAMAAEAQGARAVLVVPAAVPV